MASLFKKKEEKEEKNFGSVDLTSVKAWTSPEEIVEEEKWIWVEGYKGVDRNLRACNNFQYEIGKEYSKSDIEPIEVCNNGFHFSKILPDTFQYYGVCCGNRFFKVKALVREKDYKKGYSLPISSVYYYSVDSYQSKMVAKAIILEEEIGTQEIMEAYGVDFEEFPNEEDWELIREIGIELARKNKKINELVELGFSKPFALLIAEKNKINEALAIGSQPNLSMDMKAYLILNT